MTAPNTIHNRIVHDEELIGRLQRGDEWVHHLLVRRFQETLFSTAFGSTLDARESREITLEVFSEAYRTIDRIQPDLTLSAWLHRLVLNRCRHWRRRLKRRSKRRNAMDGQPAAEVDGKDKKPPANPAPREEQRHRVGDTLGQLPDPVRTAFLLREMVGLSHPAVGAVMGVTVGVVRSRLLNARRRLGKIFGIELALSEDNADGPVDASCDELLIDRYLNGDLGAEEKARLKEHLADCTRCRRYVVGLINFREDLRGRVRQAVEEVDMVALEKQALTAGLRPHRSRRRTAGFTILLRLFLLMAAIVGGLYIYVFHWLR